MRELEVDIQRRIDLQPALVDAIPSEALHELLADLFLEILAERFLGPQGIGEVWQASHRGVIRRTVDRTGVAHRRASTNRRTHAAAGGVG